MNHLLSVWLSEGKESTTVRRKLEEKIDSYAAGELDHAVDAMSCIWEISNRKKEPIIPNRPASVSCSTPVPSAATGFSGCNIKPALVKSIKEGHLLDRKYWVKRSREGWIEPIYFSSTATSAELLGFDACESPARGDARDTKPCSVGAPPGIRRAP